MKKLLALLIFGISSHALAVTINCPTAKNYTFDNKQWTLTLEKNTPTHDLTHNFGKDFYNYDPWLKVVEGHPVKQISAMGFNYGATSTRAKKDEKGITLECNGTYLDIECPNSSWFPCTDVKGNFKSYLALGNEYKYCMSISESSFDCEK